MHVRGDTYPGPPACEVGWPVPFPPPLSLQCCHQVPTCCWVSSERAFSQGIELDSNRRPSVRGACAITTMPSRPQLHYILLNTPTILLSKREGHLLFPYSSKPPSFPSTYRHGYSYYCFTHFICQKKCTVPLFKYVQIKVISETINNFMGKAL